MTAFDGTSAMPYADSNVAVADVPAPVRSRAVRSVKLRVIGGTVELRDDVPRTTAECPTDRSRCGHVKCEWHLWMIDRRDRRGRRSETRRLPWSELRPIHIEWPLPPACGRDAIITAIREGWTLAQMGDVLGIGGEGFRYLKARALAKCKIAVRAGIPLADFLDGVNMDREEP